MAVLAASTAARTSKARIGSISQPGLGALRTPKTRAARQATATRTRARVSLMAGGFVKIGPAGPVAAPLMTTAASPEPRTITTDATAIHNVIPECVIRASSSATTGTVASDSALEYASRSARPRAGRRNMTQKYPGSTIATTAAQKARMRSTNMGTANTSACY